MRLARELDRPPLPKDLVWLRACGPPCHAQRLSPASTEAGFQGIVLSTQSLAPNVEVLPWPRTRVPVSPEDREVIEFLG